MAAANSASGLADAGSSAAAPSGPARDAGSASSGALCDQPGEFRAATGDACYLLSADAVNWLEASDRCRAWGGTLVRVELAVEDALLDEQMSSDAWIGLNDRDAEGVLLWAGGEALSGYTNWAAEQPDDFGGAEDCVEKLADGRGWNDRPCDDPRPYFCER